MQLFSAPEFVNWNFTYACNLQCRHCYSRADRYPIELDTSAYLSIAEDLVRSGVFTVSFGGGEPLLRRDFRRVHEILNRGGVETYLTTNGWFCTEETALALREEGLDLLLVSIDDANEQLNDATRGKGSFMHSITALKNAVDAGLRCGISCVVSRRNKESLQPIVDLANALGVNEVEFKKFRPSGNGHTNSAEFELGEDSGGLLRMTEALTKHSLNDVRFVGFSPYSDAKICACGWRSLCIRPNGDVSHCPYTDTVVGNLQARRLCDLWLTSPVLADIRQRKECEGAQGASSPSTGGTKVVALTLSPQN